MCHNVGLQRPHSLSCVYQNSTPREGGAKTFVNGYRIECFVSERDSVVDPLTHWALSPTADLRLSGTSHELIIMSQRGSGSVSFTGLLPQLLGRNIYFG